MVSVTGEKKSGVGREKIILANNFTYFFSEWGDFETNLGHVYGYGIYTVEPTKRNLNMERVKGE